MKIWKHIRRTAFVATACSLAMPTLARAAEPQSFTTAMAASEAPAAIDVALAEGGTLRGQLVDPQGRPLADSPVQLRRNGTLLATTSTDENGTFELTGVGGGSYLLASVNCNQHCRLWAPGTAPPATKDALLLISCDPLMRGSGGYIFGALGNPWVLGGVTAAALAVPLALDHDGSS